MFSVNLTSTALQDEHFIKFVELCLAKSALPMGTIAFEIDAATALTLAGKDLGCRRRAVSAWLPLVLDDFALLTECFALLRLPGVRYIKLAPEITAKMRTDKISQAAITAVVQMARVLGMHTVAKADRHAGRTGMADGARRGFHPIQLDVAARGHRIAAESPRRPGTNCRATDSGRWKPASRPRAP